MNTWGRFAGILGLVCLGFGLLSFLIFRGAFDLYTGTHLILGVLLIGYWFVMVGMRKSGEATQIISGRTVRFGTNAIIYTAVFIAILVGLNWIANRHNKRWDLTEQGVYSLASQSSQVIENLKKPLKIAAFDVGADNQQMNLKDMLGLFKDRNPQKVTTEFVNPRAKPQLVEKYGMKGGNIIYLEYGEGEGAAVSRLNEVSEEALTNAIMKLTQGDAKKIYYLNGHGERKLDDAGQDGLKAFADAVKDEHLTMEEIVLSTKQTVPTDAAAIMLMSPKSPLLPGERDLLTKYVEDGGRLLLFADPKHGDDVPAIASHFGIEVGNDVLIDLVQRLMMGPTLATQFLSGNFTAHPITHGLSRQDAMVFDTACSVRATGKSEGGVTYTELIKTSDQGWAEKNLKSLFDDAEPTAALDGDDIKGPVSLAVAYEKKAATAPGQEPKSEGKVSRLVVFGDSDWIDNQNFRYSSHRDVVLNSLNWLAGQESNISIRPRSMRTSMKPLQSDTFRTLLMSGFLVPEVVLIFGLVVWWRRRIVAA